jgi:anti-sigma B factor antagonist
MLFANFHPVYIDVQEDDRAARVSLKLSRLTEDENIELLGRELFTLVEQSETSNMILSLRNVQYATSAFLGKLITLHRKLHRKQGKLVLCDAGDEFRGILQTSRLHTYFHLAVDGNAARETLG